MITVSTPINETPRTAQLRGLFDIPPSTCATETWDPKIQLDRPWNIGLIHGPSGCGKSTIANALFPRANRPVFEHDQHQAVIESFPTQQSLKQITEILSSVGLSSPPSWLKPYQVLSTGQKFRADIALMLSIAEPGEPVLCDEYTSVIDRQVAQIASAAIARTVRARNLQFIAVSCHSDILEWLQPDWTYEPAENLFRWRSLQRRPPINLEIVRCSPSAWTLFAPHHYLTAELSPYSQAWLASIRGQPVAFSSWLHFFGRGQPAKREHRTVCLPDYQGVGIGNTLSKTIASMWKALGYRALSTTTHPGMTASRTRSTDWQMTRAPALSGAKDSIAHANTRLTAGFAYVGPPMSQIQAKALLAKLDK